MEISQETLIKLQQARVEEFKNRLRSTVNKHTCDHLSRGVFDTFAKTQSTESLREMLIVYYLKYQQLVDDVLDQK